MDTLAKKLKDQYETPYQKIAREYHTAVDYVYQIASGKRKPQRGKGLKIKQRLEELVNKNENEND